MLHEQGRELDGGAVEDGLHQRGVVRCARALLRAAAQIFLQAEAQAGESLEVAGLGGEVVVGVGQDLLLDLLDIDGEDGGAAGDVLVVPVVGGVHAEAVLADGQADHLIDDAGDADHHALAEVELGVGPLEDLLAVDRGVDVGLDAVVEFGGAVDGLDDGVLAAHLEDGVLDVLLGDADGLLDQGDVPVGAEVDLGGHGHARADADGVAVDGFDLGRADGRDALLLDGLLVGLGDHALDGLFEDGVGAERLLDDDAGGLALAEAGDAIALREPLGGLIERLGHALIVELDLEEDLGLGDAFGGDFHAA